MNKQRGFTLFELIFAILWLLGLGLSLYIIYWVILALMKYVGA